MFSPLESAQVCMIGCVFRVYIIYYRYVQDWFLSFNLFLNFQFVFACFQLNYFLSSLTVCAGTLTKREKTNVNTLRWLVSLNQIFDVVHWNKQFKRIDLQESVRLLSTTGTWELCFTYALLKTTFRLSAPTDSSLENTARSRLQIRNLVWRLSKSNHILGDAELCHRILYSVCCSLAVSSVKCYICWAFPVYYELVSTPFSQIMMWSLLQS